MKNKPVKLNVLNNSYTLGGIGKQAVRVVGSEIYTLSKKTPEEEALHHRSYEDVLADVTAFDIAIRGRGYDEGEERPKPTVSLYMENARAANSDLYLLCIDDDSKCETPLGLFVQRNADVATVSMSGCGGHRYFGVRKDDLIWDGLNLLSGGASYISKTGMFADDGTKIDVFMDAKRFIFERSGFVIDKITDKTDVVIEIMKQFHYKRTTETSYKRSGRIRRASYGSNKVLPLEDIKHRCNEIQLKMVDQLETMSAAISQSAWYSEAKNISCIFQEDTDLGCDVFVWWSAKDYEGFNISQPIRTWENVCDDERESYLSSSWNDVLGISEEVIVVNEADTVRRKVAEEAQNAAAEEFIKESEVKSQIELDRPLYVCSKEIKWGVDKINKEAKSSTNEFGDVIIGEVRSSNLNRIEYDGNPFTVIKFFRHLLGKDYLTHSYRAKFSSEAEKHLSNNQLSRLQYDVLNHKFWTPEYKNPLSIKDRKELELFICRARVENGTAGRLKSRLKWDFYWDNAMMFGATKAYKKKGITKTLFFYTAAREGNTFSYSQVDYNWEKYAAYVVDKYDSIVRLFKSSVIINNALLPSLYYQDGVRITLPREYQLSIMGWASKLARGEAVEREFPFCGEIPSSEARVEFKIDLENTEVQPLRTAEEQRVAPVIRASKERALVKHTKDLEVAGFKSGEEVTTKEFASAGINKSKLIALKKSELIESISRGIYKVI